MEKDENKNEIESKESKDGTNENTGSEYFNVTMVTIDKWESPQVSSDAVVTGKYWNLLMFL